MTWILPKQLHTSASALATEALISDLGEQSHICAQSLLARSKRSPARTWSLKWKRDSWTQHLSGRMLRRSLGPDFTDAWTSFLAATLASHLAQPESGSARTTQDTSGLGSQTEFGFASPASAFSRTSKDTSALGSEKSLESWRRSVTEQRGEYSARLKSARLTNASECSSWPTVCANEDSYRIGGDSQQSKCLSAMARRGEMGWPSPSSRDHKGAPASRCTPEGYNARLDEAVILHGRVAPANPSSHGNRQGLSEDWRTPTVAEEKNQNTSNQIYLQNQVGATVKQWATPIMGDSHLASTPEVAAKRLEEGKVTLSRQKAAWPTPASSTGQGGAHGLGGGSGANATLKTIGMAEMGTGKLNPRWVETLMGLPVGWTMPSCAGPVTIAPTSCDSSATESSQPPQNELFGS